MYPQRTVSSPKRSERCATISFSRSDFGVHVTTEPAPLLAGVLISAIFSAHSDDWVFEIYAGANQRITGQPRNGKRVHGLKGMVADNTDWFVIDQPNY